MRIEGCVGLVSNLKCAAGHPIARSAEPGEDWAWCYVDQTPVDVGAR